MIIDMENHNASIEFQQLNGHNGSKLADVEEEEEEDDLEDLSLTQKDKPKPTLTYSDKRNLVFLFGLYFIHHLPFTFSWATMPIMLRQQVSYSVVGIYLIAQYPYTIKVLWSPIVGSLQLPFLGERKSWLIPCFIGGAAILYWLASHQDNLISRLTEGKGEAMPLLLLAWISLTTLCANIRIALDAWALELVSHENVTWVGTVATGGEMTAYLISFNLFLGLSSLSFGESAQEGQSREPSVTFYFHDIAIGWTAVAILLCLFKDTSANQKSPDSHRSLRTSYKLILRIIKPPPAWILFLVHITSMVGFMTNDGITMLQLVKNNFSDSSIAVMATIVFPISFLGGIYVSVLFRTHHPLAIWRALFPYRLLAAILAQMSVMLLYTIRESNSRWRYFIPLLPGVMSTFLETTMFVALVSFHAMIADARYGGIYLPLLATTLTIRYDILGFIYTKIIGWLDESEGPMTDMKCPTRLIDGYQIVNFVGVVIAIPIFWWFLIPATKYLESVEEENWKIEDDGLSRDVLDTESQAYESLPLENRFEIGDEEEDRRSL